MSWADDDEWGKMSPMKLSTKGRFALTRKIEENILKELSKNKFGFEPKRYSVYNDAGEEVAQTILTKTKKRVRCPDIQVSHPSSWDDISLRIEVKDHDRSFDGFVRTECKKFHDYIYLLLRFLKHLQNHCMPCFQVIRPCIKFFPLFTLQKINKKVNVSINKIFL